MEGDKEIFVGTWELVFTIKKSHITSPPYGYTVTTIINNENHQIEFLAKGKLRLLKNGVEIEKKSRIVFAQFESSAQFANYYNFNIYRNNKTEGSFSGRISNDTLVVRQNASEGYPPSSWHDSAESYFVKK